MVGDITTYVFERRESARRICQSIFEMKVSSYLTVPLAKMTFQVSAADQSSDDICYESAFVKKLEHVFFFRSPRRPKRNVVFESLRNIQNCRFRFIIDHRSRSHERERRETM